MTEFVPRPADIDAKFLSTLFGADVTAVVSSPVGTGQVGATFRFNITYAQPTAALPQSVIGKFPSLDPLSRATGIAQLSYVREVNFYKHYGSEQSLPIPHCLFSALDEETHDFALIMGDLPDHHAGNQLEPSSLPEALLAVSAAAKLHAAHWGNADLDTKPWLGGSLAAPAVPIDELYSALWPAFCARYADRVTPAMRAAGDAYVGRVGSWSRERPGVRCLTHGDFRPDNMLFNTGDSDRPIIIVDWQTAGVGSGATDIAYFLGTALAPDMRREHERGLFDKWCEGLSSSGVTTFDATILWDVYRRDAFAGFLMGVVASMIVVQTERGDTMFLTMCERSAEMINDHASASLFH